MEHPTALRDSNGIYTWHSGAPDDESFDRGHKELIDSIDNRLAGFRTQLLNLKDLSQEDKAVSGVTNEFVKDAYGETLLKLAEKREDLVVLDADLAEDCRVRDFELKYPERFIECGIAEQDMVSTAGGLALQGLLPVTNSFASFLASRANEQIYTNAGEGTKIIYGCHFAGLIPACPGLSHQSIRDISLFGSLPNVTILQPGTSEEMRSAVEYCIEEAQDTCMIRIAIGPSPRKIELPQSYIFKLGRGCTLRDGNDAILFAYGPVMLHEALVAAECLAEQGTHITVVNMPSLNKLDRDWFVDIIRNTKDIFILEDHSPVGGLGDFIISELCDMKQCAKYSVSKFGVDEFPKWGTPSEVLAYHKLDGQSVAKRILSHLE